MLCCQRMRSKVACVPFPLSGCLIKPAQPFFKCVTEYSCILPGRREELTKLQKSVLGIEDIFQREGLVISEEEVTAEAEAAAAEALGNGEEMDLELLQEQVKEVLKVSQLPLSACASVRQYQPMNMGALQPRHTARPLISLNQFLSVYGLFNGGLDAGLAGEFAQYVIDTTRPRACE